MRKRQEQLTAILTREYGNGGAYPNSLTWYDLDIAGLKGEVTRTYKRLGGILERPPLSFGNWDVSLGNFIVELDESQHFNRYRAITLNSFVYHVVKGFDVMEYSRYCLDYEDICLKKMVWGKYWTSTSSEILFGAPGVIGKMESIGSPRWRQRAFYDYLRDVYAIINRIPLIRISVYDKVNPGGLEKSVNDVLLGCGEEYSDALVEFIEQKLQRVL